MSRRSARVIEALDTPTVCRLARISPRTLDYWVRTGLVRPSVRPSSGRRVPRLWSVSDAVEVRTIKALRDSGCPLQRVRKARLVLQRRWKETASDQLLYWDGLDLLAIGPWGEVSSLLIQPGQQVLHVVAVPVGRWRQESEHAVAEWRLYSTLTKKRAAK